MKYKKKPVIIEAMQLPTNVDDAVSFYDWLNNGDCDYEVLPNSLKIKTLEGIMVAKHDDYVIKGVKGEFYPCKAYIFKETYEAMND